MNKHHSMDEAFRKKLRDFEMEPSDHLWEQIVQKRNWRHRALNRARKQSPMLVLGAALLMAGLNWLAWPESAQAIQSFPIPLSTAIAPVASTAPAGTPSEQSPALIGEGHTNTLPPSVPARPAFVSLPPATATPALALAANMPSAVTATQQEEKTTQLYAATLPAVRPIREAPAPAVATLMEQHSSKQPGILKGIFSPEPKCAEFGNGYWSFYFDALASPDLSIRQMSPRNPEYEEYVQSRRETESNMYAFSGALRLSMVSDKGLAVRTGVNYSQINEKFTYYSGSEEIIKYINRYDQDGTVIGTDTVIEVGARHKITHNQYRMLDIPFLVGYEINKGKLDISLNGGAYLNLLFRQKGDFLSPQDMRPVSFDSGDPDAYPAFKQAVGLGWYGSLGLAYRLKPRVQLILEPHIKAFPKSVTQEQFAVSQHYLTTGLFIGLRHQL
ncbi:MAG: hypothetical protein KDC66_23270 [Phaeodactylibacter sp.]|nr:hypothetical protein [Phaeodactylibacter sp.]MCB9276402.1 hypothetical protein [Lewinellaceae bacterium]